MEYELFLPSSYDSAVPLPVLVSISGRDMSHVNGLSKRLPNEGWIVAVPLKPPDVPPFFEGRGHPGDGAWHLKRFCDHLRESFKVDGGRFFMVGVSNGGNACLRFATLWPELCRGLLVITGNLPGDTPVEELRRLQGIPIDMYVGNRDEMGFYTPMKKLQRDLRALGQQPCPHLTVFHGAGHVCSPLVSTRWLHSRIWLMLLWSEKTGRYIRLPLPDAASGSETTANLCKFCDEMGLQRDIVGNQLVVRRPDMATSVISREYSESEFSEPDSILDKAPKVTAGLSAFFALLSSKLDFTRCSKGVGTEDDIVISAY